MSEAAPPAPFELHGAVYLPQPTGRTAANLDELMRAIAEVDAETLFLHTQMPRLAHSPGQEAPHDDLSAWVRGVVQDAEIAERLTFAVHAPRPRIEEVRAALVAVLAEVPERTRIGRDAPAGGAFPFLRFDAVRVPIAPAVETPEQLVEALASADPTVWFHHVIEEPWLGDGASTLVAWLRAAGEGPLAAWLAEEAASGLAIEDARLRVVRRWRRSRIGRRVAESARRSDLDRQAVARATVGRLARRLAGKPPS